MRIIDAEWAKTVNALLIECTCGRRFKHRSDRWNVICPACKAMGKLDVLREQYVEEAQDGGA